MTQSAPLQPRLDELASMLAHARSSGTQIDALPAVLVPESVDDAYAVDGLVAERLGWDLLGWKIAGTAEAVRARLKLDGPIYGRSYRRFATLSPTRLETAGLLDPLIECEFFVTLSDDLPPSRRTWTIDDVRDRIARVHAGIEVAECRFPSSALPPLPAVLADGSASGRYVFGDEIEAWRDGLVNLPVVLEVDGVERRTGVGSDVMGDPLLPIVWLANERSRWRDGLRAGEVISTGSMTGMFPVRDAKVVLARFGETATVEIHFDG